MAVKSLYLKNAAPSGATASMSLQDGGTAPAAAITTTGWTVARLTSTSTHSAMLARTERASTTFAAADAIPTFAASASWRSENAINGNFANTSWTLAFKVRAVSSATAQTGAIKVRLWRSSNADGSGAVQLTSAVVSGTTTAALSTTVSQTSTVTWSPGAIVTLSNEYLWVQCEWAIVGTATNNAADVLFYVESAAVVTTPDFTAIATHHTLTATAEQLDLGGQNATMRYAQRLAVTADQIDLNEQTATTLVARRLGATVDQIDLNEQTSGLRSARRLAVTATAIALDGNDADLVLAEAPAVHHTLTAERGFFSLWSEDAILTFAEGEPITDHVLDADPALLALAGELASLTLTRGYPREVQPGPIRMGHPRIRLHAW